MFQIVFLHQGLTNKLFLFLFYSQEKVCQNESILVFLYSGCAESASMLVTAVKQFALRLFLD